MYVYVSKQVGLRQYMGKMLKQSKSEIEKNGGQLSNAAAWALNHQDRLITFIRGSGDERLVNVISTNMLPYISGGSIFKIFHVRVQKKPFSNAN